VCGSIVLRAPFASTPPVPHLSYWIFLPWIVSEVFLGEIDFGLGLLLVILGLGSYLGTGSLHPTALIPTWFGLALGIFGFLAISPDEKWRKLFMHINVTIGLLGFLGAPVKQFKATCMPLSAGLPPDKIALGSQLTMAALLLIFVILCIRSFIAARARGRFRAWGPCGAAV